MKSRYAYALHRKPVRVEQLQSMPNYFSSAPVQAISAGCLTTNDLAAKQPLLITNAMGGFEALERWQSDEYLCGVSGGAQIEVTPCLLLDAVLMKVNNCYSAPCAPLRMSVAEYLFLMTGGYDPTRIRYARNIPIPDGLSRDVSHLPFLVSPETRRTIFFGRRTYTDSHEHGGSDAFLCQIRGTKEVILHPPDALHKKALYARFETSNWSPVRFFDYDEQAFPLFRHNRPLRTLVRAGEVLYIPNPWWHAVVSADDELDITVTYWFDGSDRLCCH